MDNQVYLYAYEGLVARFDAVALENRNLLAQLAQSRKELEEHKQKQQPRNLVGSMGTQDDPMEIDDDEEKPKAAGAKDYRATIAQPELVKNLNAGRASKDLTKVNFEELELLESDHMVSRSPSPMSLEQRLEAGLTRITTKETEVYQKVKGILLSGTLAPTEHLPAHYHVADYNGSDWEDESQPPPGAGTVAPGTGAWRCVRGHAYGNYYMSSAKSGCPGCGQSATGKEQAQDWDIDFDKTKRGTGWVLYARRTNYFPDLSKWDVNSEEERAGSHHNGRASRMRVTLRAEFPGLSNEELKVYWSRFVRFSDKQETQRKVNRARRLGRNVINEE